jgi:regulator of replication initiation timing
MRGVYKMNNICKQIEIEYENPTIMDMMSEINRLTQELSEVKAENYILRNDNEVLHKIAQNQIELELLKNDKNNEGGWTEEETLLLSNIYAEAEKDYKFD